MAASVQRSFFPLISGSYFDELTTLKKNPRYPLVKVLGIILDAHSFTVPRSAG